MFVELPQNLILYTAGAFFIGWILSAINARISARQQARKRDPRDDRIRSLEADLRIAQGEATKSGDRNKLLEEQLKEANAGIEKRDNVISHQQKRVEELTKDLKDSVIKTRELRNELSERATQNIKSELKIREVETELEVAQASTDLIATGVLDYSLAPDSDDDDEQHVDYGRTAT